MGLGSSLAQAFHRPEAYRLPQDQAMVARDEDGRLVALNATPEAIGKLSVEGLEASLELDYHLSHADSLFAKAFLEPSRGSG